MLCTNQPVALVINPGRGLHFEPYDSKLDLILQLMNNGSIGGDSGYYGSPEHLDALNKIEQHLTVVRKEIAKDQEREKRAEGCCSDLTPCCDRVDEYNGYGSDGPLSFVCPKHCPCHD